MRLRKNSEFDQVFRSQLLILREQIEKLPSECSEPLRALADDIESQHRQMQDGCANASDLVDDLSLAVKAARFNLWASQMDNSNPKEGGF